MTPSPFRNLVATAALLWIASASPALAQATANYAWVWAGSPQNSGCYTPDPNYSYSTRGGTNQVCNNGVGLYTVDFAGFTAYGGNVQVSAYGDGNPRCKVSSWLPTSTAMRASIRCHAPNGALANSAFVAFYRIESRTVAGGQYGAYLWTNNATASHTPPAMYQWNASGVLNTVQHNGTGQYNAILSGQNTFPNSLLVTAYGTGSEHCKVAGWGVDSTHSNMVVTVRCYDTTGALANSQFTLSYTRSTHHLDPGGNVWASDTTSANYTPVSWYQYNSTYATNTAVNHATGASFVRYPNLWSYGTNVWNTPITSSALVTAHGYGSEYCKVYNWHHDVVNPGATRVNVRCFTAGGSPVSTPYTSAFMNTDFPAP